MRSAFCDGCGRSASLAQFAPLINRVRISLSAGPLWGSSACQFIDTNALDLPSFQYLVVNPYQTVKGWLLRYRSLTRGLE